tara:strand:- start:2083 stop:2388 length:306 start_codon:yes stop_codon:yes gene_type:complete
MQEKSYPLEVDVEFPANEFALLDVRKPAELSICNIEGSIEVNMNEIPSHLDKIPGGGMVLVLCHHGSKSAAVTSFVRQNGFDMAGRIDAWPLKVNSQLARY